MNSYKIRINFIFILNQFFNKIKIGFTSIVSGMIRKYCKLLKKKKKKMSEFYIKIP